MANISFTTNTQIIRDIYDTPEEAISASKTLGCDGYRTYEINGQVKYVPCISFLQYEKALRYRVVQGKIGAFGSDTFGDKLVGLQFANSKNEIGGDPFFTLGNFSIQKSVLKDSVKENKITFTGGNSLTVNDIANRNLAIFNGKDYIETLKNQVSKNLNVSILFDKRKLDNYVLFSSLKERFKGVLIDLFNKYPAAIRFEPVSILTPTISEYAYFSSDNKSEFKINLNSLINPFGIEYSLTGTTINDDENVTKYRNFSKTYLDYVVHYNGVDYPITTTTLPNTPNDTNNGIRLTVIGNPFSDVINLNDSANVGFYLKPKNTIYNNFYNNLDDLTAFLLNKDESGDFISEFLYPTIDNNGLITTIKEVIRFPKFDDFNIDMFSDRFDVFTTTLNDYAETYDSVKTNIISRKLTTDSLKEFDTEDRKVSMLLQLFGYNFDNVRKYIDGITFMRNVSYDKIENIPDLLIKNYATMLGLETFNVEDESTLIESLFSFDLDKLEKSLTPVELDIEIWRRILINSIYLFKSKGTRKSIEFILKLVGLPDDIFEINEYVYVADKKIDTVPILNKIYNQSNIDDFDLLLNEVPFDLSGNPKQKVGTTFQDQTYMEQYRKYGNIFLFDTYKTIDNVKSWVYSDTLTNYIKDTKNTYTEYQSDSTDLIVNSKEIDILISTSRIFDVSVYRQYNRNIGIVNSDLNILRKFNANGLSFNQFLNKSLNTFINTNNRKTIKTYPTLSKIYFDYLKTTNNQIDNIKSLDFLNKFDSSWVKLVQQFLPTTTLALTGKSVQNSSFIDNKFIYKHGLNNTTGWLGSDGSEFQEKAIKPVFVGTTNGTNNVGLIKNSVVGNTNTFNISGLIGSRILGLDTSINEYFGVYYSMLEYCDEIEGRFYNWEPGVDYGDDSLFGGNINTGLYNTNPRYGVFVTYNGSLYRLNTIYLFQGTGHIPNIHTAGNDATDGTILPPNIATITNNLNITKKIWDKVPFNVNSRTIQFSDTLSLDIRSNERSFYINSIGRSLAYLGVGITFDCPPPKPHVCYYDFTGKNISMVLNTYKKYVDNEGVEQTVKQPKHYGYSRDYNTLKPTKTSIGSKKRWLQDYAKRFEWVDGNVYYKNDIIAKVNSTNKENLDSGYNIYVVTGNTITGTTTYPTTEISGLKIIGTSSGTTVNENTIVGSPGGMFERYEDRTTTDPFMHVDPAFISKIDLNPNSKIYSINLSKSLNLSHIFSGETSETTYRVRDNIVNGELYISDSINVSFDGFYPLKNDAIGPFYTLNGDNLFVNTLDKKLTLIANTDNYVSIQSLNENFNVTDDNLTLVNTNNSGYYLVKKNCKLNINVQLYFESIYNVNQTVNIKLINKFGFNYITKNFTFNGESDSSTRIFTFNYDGFFNSGDNIYLAIEPVDLPCTLSRYEEISYNHINPSELEYNMLNDPRFRLLHYSGFSGFNEYIDGYSIKPIYNLNDLSVKNLTLTNSNELNLNQSLPVLNVEHSFDPNFIFNKIFSDYYIKYGQPSILYNTVALDKLINYDKIDFTFKVRSKDGDLSKIPLSTNPNTGVKSNNIEVELDFNDWYLDNSVIQTEYSNISNAITIGKNIGFREINTTKKIQYIPKYSFYDNIALGSSITSEEIFFTSFNNGLKDYFKINYSNNLISELRNVKRYITGVLGTSTYNVYELENKIYNSEIYQKILNNVPEFNPRVINYELNDIVKVPIDGYKMVVETTTGTNIQTVTKYKLYVCINDINSDHCYKLPNNVQGEIHPIYRPNGSRSCFVEIEKYNTANYTPWGYEQYQLNTNNNVNISDYIYRNINSYDPQVSNEFNYGDLFLGNVGGNSEFFKFVYQKDLVWDNTKKYYAGDYIVSGVTEGLNTMYRFFVARLENENKNPNTETTFWSKITTDLFDHKSLQPTIIGSIPGFDDFVMFSNTTVRLPKTLPISTDGVPFIATGTTVSGVTFTNRWNNILVDNASFLDAVHASFDKYDVTVTNKILKSVKLNGSYYGTDSTIISNTNTPTGKYLNSDDYTDFYNTNRAGKTNILLPQLLQLHNENDTAFKVPYLTDMSKTYPLFERIGRLNEKNNPTLFVATETTGVEYNSSSKYLGYKYAVNRGVLYKYIGTTPMSTYSSQPYEDTNNWIESDFCLVNKFKFYKDRVKVTVNEYLVESLSDDVKNDLYFFTSDLNLKNGFTNRSFSGTTINNQLIHALNLFYDTTDTNRVNLNQFGGFDFRNVSGDIIMDYIIDKDNVGYPRTGEFLGKLKIFNPCGQTATTFFGVLFNTDINQFNPDGGLVQVINYPNELIDILPYQIRLIITQNGESNATLLTKQLNSTTNYVESDPLIINKFSSFDTTYSVIPETNFNIKLSYNTFGGQTKFNSGRIDDIDIFVNNNIVNNTFFETNLILDNLIETREINLKNINKNMIIRINLDGITKTKDIVDIINPINIL